MVASPPNLPEHSHALPLRRLPSPPFDPKTPVPCRAYYSTLPGISAWLPETFAFASEAFAVGFDALDHHGYRSMLISYSLNDAFALEAARPVLLAAGLCPSDDEAAAWQAEWARTRSVPVAARVEALYPVAAGIGAGKKLAGRRTAQEEEIAAVFEDKRAPRPEPPIHPKGPPGPFPFPIRSLASTFDISLSLRCRYHATKRWRKRTTQND